MIKPLFSDTKEGQERLSTLLKRSMDLTHEHEAKVKAILNDVKENGNSALVKYTREFDAPEFSDNLLLVQEWEVDEAYKKVDQEFLSTIRKAISNIEAFHKRQVPRSWFMTRENGVILGQMANPVDACGLYVPGGKGGTTPLVSSVLMNAIPARIAGVSRMVLATPPSRDCGINPYLLVSASECGIKEIYRMGSAWAIGAMAFGTEIIKPVDVIVGPGNIFVTLAKKIVSGLVGIDMIAGPSEILIIADSSANPAHIAADLLSQAEHDPLATSAFFTNSLELANKVSEELSRQLEMLERREIAASSLEKNGIILVVKDMDEAAELANKMAPEHLELLVSDPWALLPRIRHAGAIFLGPYTPEPVGDYMAGPNHVLPTMGTARFSSALGVETFMKRSSIISYSREAFNNDAKDIIRLAEIEGLTAHARSVKEREE